MIMARPLRVEFAEALYHVTLRGDGQEDIYLDNIDSGISKKQDLSPFFEVSQILIVSRFFSVLFVQDNLGIFPGNFSPDILR